MKSSSNKSPEHRGVLAACAVALATAMGSGAISSSAQANTIAKLERYCAASWRNAGIRRDDWEDCTQQALLELLEVVSDRGLPLAVDDSESLERRELNRAVWRLVQRCRRAPHTTPFDECRMEKDVSRASENEPPGWDELMAASVGLLSPRQCEILELTRDGWRVAEIARHLRLLPDRVSDEKYKAIAKLRDRFAT